MADAVDMHAPHAQLAQHDVKHDTAHMSFLLPLLFRLSLICASSDFRDQIFFSSERRGAVWNLVFGLSAANFGMGEHFANSFFPLKNRRIKLHIYKLNFEFVNFIFNSLLKL
jgi:hypothetical protein